MKKYLLNTKFVATNFPHTEYKRIESEMRKIKSTLNTLKKRNENAKNREDSMILLDQAKEHTEKPRLYQMIKQLRNH